MVCNKFMDKIITRVYSKGITPHSPYKIQRKKTLDGNDFFVAGNFCGISTENITRYGKELTDLEWCGNELYFTEDTEELLEEKLISAYLGLKQQLEEEFPEVYFDLVVSTDLEYCAGTIWVYEVRDGYHYIEPDKEKFSKSEDEGILVDTVNYPYLEKYLPELSDELKEMGIEINLTEDKEIQLVNPYYDEHMYLEWDEEFTFYFSYYHGHYDEDSRNEMLWDIKNIISGKWAAVIIENHEDWISSLMCICSDENSASVEEGLRRIINMSDNRNIKKEGSVISISAWNPKDNRKYLVTEDGIKQIKL